MRDPDDFDAFYAATSRRLVGQVYAVTGDLSEAEDAVQEAYTRAWQRWSSISTYHDPEAWLRTVAYRITVNAWWKAKNRLAAAGEAGAGVSSIPVTIATSEPSDAGTEKPPTVPTAVMVTGNG